MLSFHHVGLLVDSIEHSLQFYSEILRHGPPSPIYEVSAEKVRVCLIPSGNGMIELVQALDPNTAVGRLRAKGATYYHVAYIADDWDADCGNLESLGCIAVTTFNSEAFEGRRCRFYLNRERQLIELIETSER
jgi:methylmalonyl-CoA/ethylmalonyl-CoA epimerase